MYAYTSPISDIVQSTEVALHLDKAFACFP